MCEILDEVKRESKLEMLIDLVNYCTSKDNIIKRTRMQNNFLNFQ